MAKRLVTIRVMAVRNEMLWEAAWVRAMDAETEQEMAEAMADAESFAQAARVMREREAAMLRAAGL